MFSETFSNCDRIRMLFDFTSRVSQTNSFQKIINIVFFDESELQFLNWKNHTHVIDEVPFFITLDKMTGKYRKEKSRYPREVLELERVRYSFIHIFSTLKVLFISTRLNFK